MTPQLSTPPNGSPVTYPTITAGGKEYQLRFAHAAWFQLQAWGFVLGDPNRPIPILALAAAAAGQVDPATGAWRSIGFARPLDLADAMLPGELLSALDAPVLEALKKAAPEADLTLNQSPAPSHPPEPLN
jgi:hypothetical protein